MMGKIKKNCLIFALLLTLPVAAFGRELTDVSLDVPISKKGAEGKQEAFDSAIEAVTKRFAEEMIGADKMDKMWSEIKSKVLKNSTKYVVFIKGSTPMEKNSGGQQIEVQLRISPDHLEAALRDAGLLGTETVRVLPLVQIVEAQGSRYLWWADLGDGRTNSIAQGYFKRFFQQLSSQFKGKNIFILDPTSASFRNSLPATYRTEFLRREDQLLLAQFLKADVVLGGRVDVTRLRSDSPEHKISYNLELWQVRTGRSLVETSRQDTIANENSRAIQGLMDQVQPQLFRRLADKLNDVVSSGNLNLSVVKIAVEGGLNPKQMAAFKKLLSAVREIRLLKERLVEPHRLTFESESTMTGEDLAKAIQKARFPNFIVDVAGVQADRLVLYVKTNGSASVR